ncbi:unnamed protein product [Caretta caretta]
MRHSIFHSISEYNFAVLPNYMKAGLASTWELFKKLQHGNTGNVSCFSCFYELLYNATVACSKPTVGKVLCTSPVHHTEWCLWNLTTLGQVTWARKSTRHTTVQGTIPVCSKYRPQSNNDKMMD